MGRAVAGRGIMLLLAAVLGACVSAPPAPIDPAQSAARLTGRSLDDPQVAQALARAGLTAQGGWDLDALTAAAWTLRPEVAAAAADVAAGDAALRVAGQRPNPTLSLGPGYVAHNANADVSPSDVAVELHVRDALLARERLDRVGRSRVAPLRDVGMAEERRCRPP